MIVWLYNAEAGAAPPWRVRTTETTRQLPLVVDLCRRVMADPRRSRALTRPLEVQWLPRPVGCLACSFGAELLCVSFCLGEPAAGLATALARLMEPRAARSAPAQHWVRGIRNYPAIATVRRPMPRTRLFRMLFGVAEGLVEAWAAACFREQADTDRRRRGQQLS